MRDRTFSPATAPTLGRRCAVTMVGVFSVTLLAGTVGTVLGLIRDRAPAPKTASGNDESVCERITASTRRWESALASHSPLATHLRPPVQGWLAGWPRVGTNQVAVGRNGWLFFRPALEHLTGPPFLAPERLTASNRRADPRPAILDFAAQLRGRGIHLVFVPVPVKAALEPEPLAGRVFPDALPLTNPSLAPLVRELEEGGVLVFDPGPVLADLKRVTGRSVYIATDTHWRPEAATAVAEALARFVRERVELDEVPDPGFTTESAEIAGRGDLVGMLGLPADSRGFAREKVSIDEVIDSDDRLWRLDTRADVLLLGDSFANVYSLPALGWGEAAGLAEQLSLALGRPVDAILRNDSGAWATRALLSRELAAGRDRLAGKRVVVWELAARELSVGDWRPIPMALGTASQGGFFVPGRGASLEVEGVITAMGVVPQPRSAPYADYVVALRLSDLQAAGSDVADREAVVFVVAMRDYALTPPAAWRVGQRVALRVRPWADMADEYGFFTRGELADDSLMLVEPCFGEEIAP